MNKQTYNGYTNGRRDKKSLLKVPIQTTIDVKLLAQAYSAMKASGMPPHSKSGILEMAFNYYMQFEGFKGQFFDESEALAFLDNERLGITIDNKRHKKAVDMFVIDNPNKNHGFIYPDQNDSNRNFSSQMGIAEQELIRRSSEFTRLFNEASKQPIKQPIIEQTTSIFGQNEPKPPMSEEERLKWKQSKGIETFNDLTQEDIESYNNYVAGCEAKGIIPASIGDFLSGNIKITL
jgi:hypothetical protein